MRRPRTQLQQKTWTMMCAVTCMLHPFQTSFSVTLQLLNMHPALHPCDSMACTPGLEILLRLLQSAKSFLVVCRTATQKCPVMQRMRQHRHLRGTPQDRPTVMFSRLQAGQTAADDAGAADACSPQPVCR